MLLVTTNQKRYHYPMGRVLSVETNSMGEVTSAKILKGDTGETVYRHSTSLILLIPNEHLEVANLVPEDVDISPPPQGPSVDTLQKPQRQKRLAAEKCKKKISEWKSDDRI